MSSRVIRDGIPISDAVTTLQAPEEIFYRRILSVVDDFGRYDARPVMLWAMLYPLKIDEVTPENIEQWLAACARAGLIRLYAVEGKDYLQVLHFDQKFRRLIGKWPPPPDAPAKTGNRYGEQDRAASCER